MYSLHLLGGISLEGPEGPIEGRAAQRRPLALLAILASAENLTASRDRLLGLVWPESPPEKARPRLSVALHGIRKALGSESVITVGDDLRLNTDVVEVDLVDFLDALDREDPKRAVELYGGSFLEGFHVRGTPAFERWLDQRQEEYARGYRRALEELAERVEAEEEWEEAVTWWRQRAAEEPYSSRVAVRLMRALDASGDRPAALRHARIHAAMVKDSLGMEPDPEVQALADRIEKGELEWAPKRKVNPTSGASPGPRISDPEPRDTVGLPSAAEHRRPPPSGGRGPHSGPQMDPVPSPKPTTGPMKAAPPRLVSTLTIAIAGALAALVLAATMWTLAGDSDAPAVGAVPGEPGTRRLAVLPFAARGGDDSAHLAESMVQLLSRSLDGAGNLVAVPPSLVLERITSDSVQAGLAERARAAVAELGAGRYVTGNVTETGERLRIDATMRASEDGRVLARGSVAGRTEDLFRLVDRLTAELLAGLETGPESRLRRMAAGTTESLPALKAYLRGERALRIRGGHAALESLRRAVTLDSTFALAHYRLAVAATQAWDPNLARRSIVRALRHADRLPGDEQTLIAAYRAFLAGDADRAESLYRRLARRDWFHVEAWTMLGQTLQTYNPLRGRPWEECIPAFEHVLSIDPDNGRALRAMAEGAFRKGQPREADSLLRLGVPPAKYDAWRRSAFAIYHLGADEELESAIARDGALPSEILDRRINHLSLVENLEPAHRLSRHLTAEDRSPGWRAVGFARVAELAASRGRLQEARAALAAAEDLDPLRALETQLRILTLPFVPADSAELAALRERLRESDLSWRRAEADLKPHLLAPPTDAWVRPYYVGLLSARLGHEVDARQAAERLEALARSVRRELPSPDGMAAEGFEALPLLARDLARGVRAELALRQDRSADALEELRGANFRVLPMVMAEWPLARRVRERWLLAELFYRTGREQKALLWFEGVGPEAVEILYRGRSWRRQTAIHDRLGNPETAARLRKLASELFDGADLLLAVGGAEE